MRMKTFLLTLALVLRLVPAALAGGRKATVHYMVLPSSIPAEKITEFGAFLDKTAGGFTAMRVHGSHQGSGVDSFNETGTAYLVAADKDFSKEFMAFAKEKLGLKSLFLLVWKADRPGQ